MKIVNKHWFEDEIRTNCSAVSTLKDVPYDSEGSDKPFNNRLFGTVEVYPTPFRGEVEMVIWQSRERVKGYGGAMHYLTEQFKWDREGEVDGEKPYALVIHNDTGLSEQEQDNLVAQIEQHNLEAAVSSVSG
jgi:hypothetical protein